MKRLEYIKKNTIEWREVPEPKINSMNQALIKPLAVSRCDLDLPVLRGETLFRAPFPIGHEFVGEVVEVSEDLQNIFHKKQKVAIAFQISCGECIHCKSGLSKSCSSVDHSSNFGLGTSGKEFGGAITDLLLIPYAKQMLVPLKETTDLITVASLSDNLVEAWKLVGMELIGNPKKSILILGGRASSISLYTAAFAKHLGAEDILFMDSDKTRLKKVEEMGIKVEEINFENSKTAKRNQRRFQIVSDCSGNQNAWDYGLRSLDVDGYFSSASIFWTNSLNIPFLELYNFGARIYLGRVKSVEWMPKILHEIEENGFNPSNIVTKVANWDDAQDAYLEEETKLVLSRF
ncbi:MAG: alcohol dehydrogenase catalytic domain-containing protein [Leptospiraceae bacterium]|nr:alcohol dehydrogenase catalytic domain-containing protein [Leptospiraceae bacterium]